MSRLFRWTILALALSLVVTGGLTGCENGCAGCGSESAQIPPTADARVDDFAAHLPQGTELVIFVADLPKMRQTLQTLKTRLGAIGLADTVQKQLQAEFGLDPLDPKSWQQAGIAPDAGLAVGYWRDRVLLLTYVDNRQAFEKVMVDQAKKAFGIEAVVKSKTEGGRQMKILSEDPARQIAWTYDGKMALVSLPAVNMEGALEKGSATLVLAEVAGTTKPKSLSAKPQFGAFREAMIGEYPIAAYVNTQAYLERPDVQKELQADPRVGAGLGWAKQNLDFVGAGLKAEGDQAILHASMGTRPELTKQFQGIVGGPKDSALKRFATENTLLGLRFNVDWDKAWAMSMANMPEDQRRAFERDLKMVGGVLGLDLEADLLSKLTGDAGVYFYGFAGNPLQLMGVRTYGQFARRAGLIAAVEMESAEAAANLVEKLRPSLEGRAEVRQMMVGGEPVEGYTVIDLSQSAPVGDVYVRGPVVAFVSKVFDEKSVQEYFEAKRSEKNLSELEGMEMGADFAAGDSFNGLYLNSARAQKNLGQLLIMGGARQIFESIEEAALKLGVDAAGPHATLVIDLAPAAGEPGAAPSKAPAAKPAARPPRIPRKAPPRPGKAPAEETGKEPAKAPAE